jgi:glycosyltransferase involved in cell wall biosynthesis
MINSLVSVIVAVKNGDRFIRTAIESIISQTYPDLEILAVDGDSTDGTVAILESFDRVRIVKQTGRGIGNAYNTGIEHAKGDFIAFLSSDDYWMPDKIERQMSALKNQSSASFAVCSAKFFLHDPEYLPPGFRPELLEEPRVAYIMETLFAHRSSFSAAGLFDEEMRNSEDVDWFARARDLKLESVVVPQVLLHKRIHDKNLHLNSSHDNRDLLRAVRNSIQRKQSSLS